MKGLIAFFDILGYQSFLENNSATDSALKVLDLITKIPADVKNLMKERWVTVIAKDKNDRIKNVAASLNHLIFSDTIVLLLPYPDDADTEWRDAAMAFMVITSARLTGTMFVRGLPVRGALNEGEFIFKETCFAGTGIVEAYRQCSRLDFAGFVLSEKLEAFITERQNGSAAIFHQESYGCFLVPILTPLKSQLERRLAHPNWIWYLEDDEWRSLEKDVIQFVMRKFWAHGKDCAVECDAKIRHTCKIIRRLIIGHEEKLRLEHGWWAKKDKPDATNPPSLK